ncbi:MAG: penicillin-binding transpeptidase domain-containing protein [Candidatus Omnitrophota bacterium]
MHNKDYKTRLIYLSFIFTVTLILILIRLAFVQLIWHSKMLKRSFAQHNVTIELPPKRGSILDRNNEPLATNLRVDSVFAVSEDVENKRDVARKLSAILDKDEKVLYERLSRHKRFVWLARKITPEQATKIQALGVTGISLIDETKRFYPGNFLGCHVIGFAGTDNVGLEGLELLYNSYLKGASGEKSIVRDAKGRHLEFLVRRHIPPVDGCSLILTIDEVIQYITEKALEEAYKKYRAVGATAIVMDPRNGDILAMANRPNYDLNDFASSNSLSRKNIAVCSYFEPGSVFKIVTASACLQEKTVSLDDVFFCENGSWYVRGHTLHDHQGHGKLTFREVIEKSSNIGTVKAAMDLGDEKLYKYVKLFGIGDSTGINLPGEIPGFVRPLNKWGKYSITAIPMGHEIGTTPIQLACAVSVIANKGLLVKPRIISKIVDSNNQTIREYEPVIKTRAITEDVALKVAEMMEGVILRGTGKAAKVQGYRVAGKTGTASKIEATGGYSKSKYVASFIGFAPVQDPVIAVCIMVDEPRPQYFGGTVAGPAFKKIVEATLRYLQVEPEK